MHWNGAPCEAINFMLLDVIIEVLFIYIHVWILITVRSE